MVTQVACPECRLLAGNAMVMGLSGGLLSLFGSSTIHIGASGLVLGWFDLLVERVMVNRSLVNGRGFTGRCPVASPQFSVVAIHI